MRAGGVGGDDGAALLDERRQQLDVPLGLGHGLVHVAVVPGRHAAALPVGKGHVHPVPGHDLQCVQANARLVVVDETGGEVGDLGHRLALGHRRRADRNREEKVFQANGGSFLSLWMPSAPCMNRRCTRFSLPQLAMGAVAEPSFPTRSGFPSTRSVKETPCFFTCWALARAMRRGKSMAQSWFPGVYGQLMLQSLHWKQRSTTSSTSAGPELGGVHLRELLLGAVRVDGVEQLGEAAAELHAQPAFGAQVEDALDLGAQVLLVPEPGVRQIVRGGRRRVSSSFRLQ